jgi:hypothetical protein
MEHAAAKLAHTPLPAHELVGNNLEFKAIKWYGSLHRSSLMTWNRPQHGPLPTTTHSKEVKALHGCEASNMLCTAHFQEFVSANVDKCGYQGS